MTRFKVKFLDCFRTYGSISTFISRVLLRSVSHKSYDKAKEQLRAIHERMNSNIPDYNPFELPCNPYFVEYPREGTVAGKVFQRSEEDSKDYKVIRQKHEQHGQLGVHTHYGFHEFVYIEYGTFLDLEDLPYIKGDVILLNGYRPHALKCLTETGSLVIAFSSTKSKLNIKNLLKHIQ